MDLLSNILKAFNDQFDNIPWTDEDRVRKLITEEIPAKVSADTAYQNAKKNSDRQNARIEHDKALGRVMTALLRDDTELFKQFSDNESFRKWLMDTEEAREAPGSVLEAQVVRLTSRRFRTSGRFHRHLPVGSRAEGKS